MSGDCRIQAIPSAAPVNPISYKVCKLINVCKLQNYLVCFLQLLILGLNVLQAVEIELFLLNDPAFLQYKNNRLTQMSN